ncbi:MAG: IclR family transcriptional regulator [Brachybacterium sp.]|uniref:IclR family transcriptional regulator n=1 Tax=Brachybacterium sp. TaxID=1891286 RepID=UPI00264892F4|nr:IclR family transcriptional regulator [Brachybacterium sp.]MDN5688447.1 IclR family transcriptional regulator [Brachybacterium sp.]
MAPPKVPAADATVRMLTFLAAQRSPIAAARIADELDLPRSRTYDLLATLVEHGYIMHLDQERVYGLGPAAHELSGAYLRQEPLARVARRVMEAMVDEVGESGHLAVLHGRDVLYVIEERARNRPGLVTDVGVRLSAHLTASGRAILAALPPAQVRALFGTRADFTSRTAARGPEGPRDLRELLARVRADGVAHEAGEVTEELASVAAVVRDHAGWPAASVAITFEEARATEADRERCTAAVRAAAAEITRRLGGRRPEASA